MVQLAKSYLVGDLEHEPKKNGNVIIPTDELIFFQKGRSTSNQISKAPFDLPIIDVWYNCITV